MTAYGDMRSHITPIPTPPLVRAGGSLLAGLSVAILVSGLGIAPSVGVAVAAVVAAFALSLLHPYRSAMRAYAKARNADTFPTLGQITPLFLWWLALMIAPALAPWPGWAAAIVFLIVAGLAWIVFPHVDGSRKLAFA